MEPDDARAPRGAQRVGVWMAVIVIAAGATSAGGLSSTAFWKVRR